MFASVASACAEDAEKALKKFEGKILILRHPLHENRQQYDAEGKVLKGGPEAPWTAYGGILIDHVELTTHKLRLEGRRMLFMFPMKGLRLLEFKKLRKRGSPPFSPSINIEITLDHFVDSEKEAKEILSRVFALNTADLLASVPDFWRDCLTDHLTYDSSLKKDAEFDWRELIDKPDRSAEPVMTADHDGSSAEPVFHVGPDVKSPQATFTPQPEFSEIARYEQFQGTLVVTIIVGKDGKIQSIRVARPLGMGLDEPSVSMTKTWRFQPGTRNGKPVAVEMNVEVSFNLY